MLYPASTSRIWPVTFRASGPHRNSAARPTSSAEMLRRSGALRSVWSYMIVKPVIDRAASVRTGPAEMALTRMFLGPNS